MSKITTRHIRSSAGFTIIELMIATVAFAVILMIVLSGLVQVSRSYYKATTSTKAQQAARALINEISQGIQLTGQTIYATDGPDGPEVTAGSSEATGLLCIGYTRYTYAIDRQVKNVPSPD